MGTSCKTARPTRAGVGDQVAQEFQVISSGNANIECPQVNFQNEISDPDECAKTANATAMQEAEKTDFSLKTKDKRSRVANPTPPDPGSSLPADPLVTLPDRSCMVIHTSWTDLNTMSSTEARLGIRKLRVGEVYG